MRALSQWAELLHHEGFPLTFLSNMPLELSRYVTKSFPSLSTFEYLIYSCDYGSIKAGAGDLSKLPRTTQNGPARHPCTWMIAPKTSRRQLA